MAYIPIEEEEEKKGQQAGSEQVTSTGDSGTTGTGEAPSSQMESKGTGFTNLNKYIEAGEGTDEPMAQKIGGSIRETGGAAQSGISSYGTKAGEQIQAGTVADEGVAERLREDPTQVQAEKFQKAYNADYGGPQTQADIEGWEDTQKNVGRLGESLGNTQDFYGRQALLREEYNRPTYSRGQQNLDAFLLGAGAGAKREFSGLRDEYQDVGQNWQAEQDRALESINAARAQTEATREATRKAYEEQQERYGGILGAAESRSAEEAANIGQQWSDLQTGLSAYDAQVAADLGLTPEQVAYLKQGNVDLSRFAKRGEARSAAQFMSPEDLAAYNALQSLTGKQGIEAPAEGPSGEAFTVNQQLLGSAQGAYQTEQDIAARLADMQAQRDTEYRSLLGIAGGRSTLGNVEQAQRLGIDVKDLAYARERGIDPTGYLSQGRALDTGDVFTDAERGSYLDMLANLGMTPGIQAEDRGDEGAAYNFNVEQFMSDIAARKAEEDAIAAQLAAQQNAPQPEQQRDKPEWYEFGKVGSLGNLIV